MSNKITQDEAVQMIRDRYSIPTSKEVFNIYLNTRLDGTNWWCILFRFEQTDPEVVYPTEWLSGFMVHETTGDITFMVL